MESISLNWEGPFAFAVLLNPDLKSNPVDHPKNKFNCSGVYLWEMMDNDGNREVYYIGKATGSPSLWLRRFHHYIFLVGGAYVIPAEFSWNQKKWICDPGDENVLATLLDEYRFKQVVTDGFKFAKAIRIYFAKVPRHEVRRVERNLLYHLQPTGTKPGTLSEPQDLVEFEHLGNFQPPKQR